MVATTIVGAAVRITVETARDVVEKHCGDLALALISRTRQLKRAFLLWAGNITPHFTLHSLFDSTTPKTFEDPAIPGIVFPLCPQCLL